MRHFKSFASDNNAGVHPTIMQAVQDANQGHVVAYGDDPYTEKAIEDIRKHFGDNTDVYFVFTGTGANVLSLQAVTNSYHSVICTEQAHLNMDECGAPEKFTGCKLLTVPTQDGKLTVEGISKHMHGFDFEHHAQPRVVSITQSTELGTVYTQEEIRKIADYVHQYGLLLHMDGARLCNAAASLNCSLRDTTVDVGVDILSFGGTKNGMLLGESILFFNKELSKNFKYIRKQGMQLGSKMRFMSAQFSAFLADDLWLKNAQHANDMAKYLSQQVKEIPQIKITQEPQVNAVFAIVPAEYISRLQEKFFFYVWNEDTSEVRWMTSFDTTKEDVDSFVDFIKETVNEE